MSPAIEVTREVNSDRMDGRRKRDTMWVELLDTEAQPARQRSHRWTVGCSSCQGVWGWWRGWGLTELNHKLHPALSDMSKHWVQGPHLTLFQLCCPASTKTEQELGTSQASIQSRCLPATAHHIHSLQGPSSGGTMTSTTAITHLCLWAPESDPGARSAPPGVRTFSVL